MIQDPYWDPYDIEPDSRYFTLVFDIDHLVWAVSERKRLTLEENPEIKNRIEKILFSHNVYERATKEGFKIENLDDYLVYAEFLFSKLLDKKAVGIKNSFAYYRSLDYADVPYERANALFDKSSSTLTALEKKALQDFMFHWIIKKSSELDLPIQIHTGYLAGNENILTNSRPTDLNNLFLKYKKVKFILFHGGYPWYGEVGSLAKMFANVYLDLVWLPQISREASVDALHQWLDCVPYNKFFWGGDCGIIEGSVGALEYTRDVLAQVLSERMEAGRMTKEVAEDVALKLFRDNALRIFNLNED